MYRVPSVGSSVPGTAWMKSAVAQGGIANLPVHLQPQTAPTQQNQSPAYYQWFDVPGGPGGRVMPRPSGTPAPGGIANLPVHLQPQTVPTQQNQSPSYYRWLGVAGGPGGRVMPRPSGTPAPVAPAVQPWSPAKIDAPQQVNVGAALGSINSGGVGGGYVVPVHNPQPNYWPSQNDIGGGNGFAGGTGWAGTNVGASATNGISQWGGDNAQNGISQWGGDNAQNAPNPFAQAVSGPAMTPEQQLAASYQQAQQSALDANQKRYDDILAGYGNTLDRTRARLEGLGDQQKQDLSAQYDRNAGRINSDLVARGMSNTTVKDNLIQGNERERASANNRLQEALTREYVGYDTGLEKDRLQFMERRSDPYPDFDQMLRLSQMMGAAGNGAGGVGMGGGVSPANGFAAPGGFGINQVGGMMGGGGGGNQLNPFQLMLLQQNMGNAQFNPNSNLNPYQQQLLQQNLLQKETGYNANNAASALYNQQWTAGSADRERAAGAVNVMTMTPSQIASFLGR